MAHTLTYNGVTFHGMKTVEYSQHIVRDPLAATDMLRHETRLTVQGTVHQWAPAPQYVEPQGATSSLVNGGAAVFRELKEQLMCPRNTLRYTVAGEDILHVGPKGSGAAEIDVTNGPWPEDLRIVGVAGDTLRVQFTISCSHISCCGNGATLPQVLSNKWSISETLDENLVLTRTVSGRLIVSSIEFNPQSFRSLVIPKREQFFRIAGISFTTAPSGMEMDYSITYRRTHAAAPAPAVDWDASHTATVVRGGIAESHVHISLMGDPSVDRRQLLGAAWAVAEARLGDLSSTSRGGKKIIENVTVSDRFSAASVELDVTVKHAATAEQTAAQLGAVFGRHLQMTGYDPGATPSPKTYGPNTLAGAFQMYLQDPCEGPFSGGSSGGGIGGVSYTPPRSSTNGQFYDDQYAIPLITIYEDKLQPYKSNASKEQEEATYNYYKIETDYEITGEKVALPVAEHQSTGDAPATASDAGPQDIKIILLSKGICYRTVKISAERIGQPPQLPGPQDYGGSSGGGGNQAGGSVTKSNLLSYRTTPHAPELMPDGVSYAYCVDCVLTFVMDRIPQFGDGLSAGSSPVDTSKPKDNRLLVKNHPDIIE